MRCRWSELDECVGKRGAEFGEVADYDCLQDSGAGRSLVVAHVHDAIAKLVDALRHRAGVTIGDVVAVDVEFTAPLPVASAVEPEI